MRARLPFRLFSDVVYELEGDPDTRRFAPVNTAGKAVARCVQIAEAVFDAPGKIFGQHDHIHIAGGMSKCKRAGEAGDLTAVRRFFRGTTRCSRAIDSASSETCGCCQRQRLLDQGRGESLPDTRSASWRPLRRPGFRSRVRICVPRAMRSSRLRSPLNSSSVFMN